MKQFDFLASREHYLLHMLPIAQNFGEQMGTFYVTKELLSFAISAGTPNIQVIQAKNNTQTFVVPKGSNPLIVSAAGDLQRWWNGEDKLYARTKIMMEHGIGITPALNNQSYAGARGIRDAVHIFLAPNKLVFDKTYKTHPSKMQMIIGTPYLDKWKDFDFKAYGLLQNVKFVAISFHWDGQASKESGNALSHYESQLTKLSLSRNFVTIGHAHPRIQEKMDLVFSEHGIFMEPKFSEIMKGASVYVNDCSSTMYEFCVSGKPVVIMNAPWFRKHIETGIRFWQYTDIGPQCEQPEELEEKIMEALQDSEKYKAAREKMIEDLYPAFGNSTQLTVDFLRSL